jgi:hypothetical protein
MLVLARLAEIPVLITACEFPLALDVVNVGYTVVAEEVFCSNAAAFVADVALVAVPLNEPTNVVAVMALFAMLALMPVTFSSATFPLAEVDVPAKYTVVFTDVLLNTAAAFVAEVALVAVPLNDPTNVVAVILLFAKFALIPDTVFNA